MQLHAVSIGEAVPRESFDAVIQSVFDSATNLRLTHEDRLITLLLSDHYELPQGIRIATKAVRLHSLTAGLRAAARGGILRLDCFPLTIDLRGASVWRCPVRELHMDMSADHTQSAWSECWALLNIQQRLHGTDIVADELMQQNTGSTLSQRMRRPLRQLIAATEQLNVEASIQAAQQMIGLGPGVTPSGDDILIGFLAALWSLAGVKPQLFAFVHSFGHALLPITIQTNEISHTYLYHAVRGEFSSSLSILAQAIARGSNMQRAAQGAMRVGHSSGMDSVTGLLLGLRVGKTCATGTLGENNSVSLHKETL